MGLYPNSPIAVSANGMTKRARDKSTAFDTIRGVRIKPSACKECPRMLACAIEGEPVDPSASCIETCQSFKNDKQNYIRNKPSNIAPSFSGSKKPTHPVLGDTYMDASIQKLFIYNSPGWVEVAK